MSDVCPDPLDYSARVTAETKERFAAIARQQDLSQSVLLKRLIAATLMTADTTSLNLEERSKPLPASFARFKVSVVPRVSRSNLRTEEELARTTSPNKPRCHCRSSRSRRCWDRVRKS